MSKEQYLQQEVNDYKLLLHFLNLKNIEVEDSLVYYIHGDSKVFWNPKIDFNQLNHIKEALLECGFSVNIYDYMVEIIYKNETIFMETNLTLNKSLYNSFLFTIKEHLKFKIL